MATIATNSHGNFTNAPRRSYIAMSSYTSDFFGYSLVFNPTTFSNVGTLSTLGVPATSTLRGSILSETGKKLYPTANAGVSTLMVSVFDHTSLLTGFINPNSPSFAIFNTDKPVYMGQGVDPGTNLSTNLGNSIYTHGSVVADGYGTFSGLLSTGQSLTVGTTAKIGSSLSTGTSITCGTGLTSFNGQNRVTNISTYTVTNGGTTNLDLEGGQVMKINLSGGNATGAGSINAFDSLGANQSTINGSVAYMIFSNTNTVGTNSTFTVTFGNNLRETGGLSVQPASTYTVSFVAMGGSMLEFSRSAGPNFPG